MLEIDANEGLDPSTLSYSDRSNISITLRGRGSERTVSLKSNGSLFTVGSGVTLTLDSNITLQGLSSNNAPLVMTNGGTLVMNEGSKITGNDSTDDRGYSSTGVYGSITMNGGTISGNGTGVYGGGIMNGGTISGNTGRGVYVEGNSYVNNNVEVGYFLGGYFEKTGGTIYGYTEGDSNSNNGAVEVWGWNSKTDNAMVSLYRWTTAGPGVDLMFDGRSDRPTWSGAWEK